MSIDHVVISTLGVQELSNEQAAWRLAIAALEESETGVAAMKISRDIQSKCAQFGPPAITMKLH